MGFSGGGSLESAGRSRPLSLMKRSIAGETEEGGSGGIVRNDCRPPDAGRGDAIDGAGTDAGT
jgi:hypothetical protein